MEPPEGGLLSAGARALGRALRWAARGGGGGGGGGGGDVCSARLQPGGLVNLAYADGAVSSWRATSGPAWGLELAEGL